MEHVHQDFHEYVNGHASTSGEGALDHCGQEAGEDSGGESDPGQAKGSRQAAGKGPSGSRRSRPGAEAKAAQRSKKTKGRVKIKMEFIENKIRRYTTFSKRKTGIMKKVSVGALGQFSRLLK